MSAGIDHGLQGTAAPIGAARHVTAFNGEADLAIQLSPLAALPAALPGASASGAFI